MEAYTGAYGCSEAMEGHGEVGPEEPFMLDLEDPDEPSRNTFGSGDAQLANWQRRDTHAVGSEDAYDRRGDRGLRASPLAVNYNFQAQQASSAKLRRNKWINRQVTQNSNNMQRLLQTIHYHITEMNAINLVTALHRLTKLAVSGSTEYTVDKLLKEPCFKQLFGIVAQQIESSAAVAPKGQPQTPPFEVQCMSMVCWSCATLRLAEERLFCIIAGIAGPRLSELKPFELSNLCWAYAKLSFGLPQLFAAIAKRMMDRKINEFSLQGLSMVVWSFATAKQKHATLFRNLAVEIHTKAADAKPQEIANTLWAYAKNRSVEAPLFNGLVDVALSKNLLWTFKPQELSNTVWSFATIALHHVPLCASMVEVVISKRWELSPQNAANILWAYSKLEVGELSGRLMPELLNVSIRRLPQHKPQEISAIVWAASRDSPNSSQFFEAAAKICANRLRDFPPQALAYMVEAYGTIEQGGPASAFSNSMMRESLDRLHQFELSALTHLLAGMVQFTQISEPEGEGGRQAEEAKTSLHTSALSTVCSCIASQVEDLQDGELPFLLQSLQVLPERSAEQEPVLEELLQVVVAEEQRREKSQGRPGSRARPPRRTAIGATMQGNRPLGEIAARGAETPRGSQEWLQPASSTQAAARAHDATSQVAPPDHTGVPSSALASQTTGASVPAPMLSEASTGTAEVGWTTASPAAGRSLLRAAATPWISKDTSGRDTVTNEEDWVSADLPGPGAPGEDYADRWGPQEASYELQDPSAVAEGPPHLTRAANREPQPWWNVDPASSRPWNTLADDRAWGPWPASAGWAGEGQHGPPEHAAPTLDGGCGGERPWQAGADPAVVPLPKLSGLWGQRAPLGLPAVPSPCTADSWTGPSHPSTWSSSGRSPACVGKQDETNTRVTDAGLQRGYQ